MHNDGLLIAVPESQLEGLELIPNQSACVYHPKQYLNTIITAVLHSLYWLPIRAGIKFDFHIIYSTLYLNVFIEMPVYGMRISVNSLNHSCNLRAKNLMFSISVNSKTCRDKDFKTIGIVIIKRIPLLQDTF